MTSVSILTAENNDETFRVILIRRLRTYLTLSEHTFNFSGKNDYHYDIGILSQS